MTALVVAAAAWLAALLLVLGLCATSSRADAAALSQAEQAHRDAAKADAQRVRWDHEQKQLKRLARSL